MNDLKEIFADGISDELAEKIGQALAGELMLKKDREHPDRYQLAGGTFTNKGLARRVARVFLETSK